MNALGVILLTIGVLGVVNSPAAPEHPSDWLVVGLSGVVALVGVLCIVG